MATMPNLETVLLELYQAVGLNTGKKSMGTVQKNRFKRRENSLEKQNDLFLKLSTEILNELGLDDDPVLNADVFKGIAEIYLCSNQLENSVWTYSATSKKVTWVALANFYIPWIARRVGFWNVRYAFDQGMPGGFFWFLPHHKNEDPSTPLTLPVSSVSRWLLDLMGEKNAYRVNEKISFEGSNTPCSDTLKRNLYNWLQGKTLEAESIHNSFREGCVIKFDGVFEYVKKATITQRFEDACKFVFSKKALTTNELSRQVPLSTDAIDSIMKESTSEEMKEHFVRLVADRWHQPSLREVRQKFMFARLMQYGYKRLLNYLCPGVEPSCSDPDKNEVMQLVALFSNIYNLTIKSYDNVKSDIEADTYFIEELNKDPISLALKGLDPFINTDALNFTANIIQNKLNQLPSNELPVYVPWSQSSFNKQVKESERLLKYLNDSGTQIDDFRKQVSVYGAKEAILQSSSIVAILNFFDNSKKPVYQRKLALARLEEFEKTDEQELFTIFAQLAYYLNDHIEKHSASTPSKVSKLIDKALKHPLYIDHSASILQYSAKHQLSMKNFDQSERLFTKALKACEEKGFGALRGEIARDSLALSKANSPKSNKRHKELFKIALFGDILESQRNYQNTALVHQTLVQPNSITHEDNEQAIIQYFLEDLYKPYFYAFAVDNK